MKNPLEIMKENAPDIWRRYEENRLLNCMYGREIK
jgi:hypothetical protein